MNKFHKKSSYKILLMISIIVLFIIVVFYLYSNIQRREEKKIASARKERDLFIKKQEKRALDSIAANTAISPCLDEDPDEKSFYKKWEAEWRVTAPRLNLMVDQHNSKIIFLIDSIINYINKSKFGDRYCWSEREDLHYLKGEFYYKNFDYENALREFSYKYNYYGDDWKQARIATYIKLKKYNNALAILKTEAKDDEIYNVLLGNYYEIIGKIDSAKFFYIKFYYQNENHVVDTLLCKNGENRIYELCKKSPKILTEFPLPNIRLTE